MVAVALHQTHRRIEVFCNPIVCVKTGENRYLDVPGPGS